MGNYTSVAHEEFTPSDSFFLSEATRNGSLDIVRLFLKKNPALVYATSKSDGSTPWHVAAASGHELVLRVLIDTTRANAVSNNFSPLTKVINKQNAAGQTPLMLACGGGFSVCVRLLLESGAHLLVADGGGRSALHYAALHNGPDGAGNDCDALIRQGPVVAPPAVHGNVIRKFTDATDAYGRTALHCAAWSGNARAVHVLWAAGADICARTDTDCYDAELPCNTGTTPLHFAAMRGNQNSGRSSGGVSDGSGDGAAGSVAASEAAPLLADGQEPAPPSPRAPAGDPRLMVDAYGMTPYSIACKRQQEYGKMLIELLDPSTDFTAGEDDDGDDQAAGGGAPAGLLRRQRYAGASDADDDGAEADSDSDSEGGAAGPLLLWEGVELIQGLAAEPEAFFKLQSVAPLLQPRPRDEPAAASGRGGGARGGGGGRASLVSLVGGRRSSSGASSSLGGGGRGVRSSGPLAEEALPDCFLCPLTCQVFRDPVVASDGVTYEREAIERHLRIVPTSPVTKSRLHSTAVYPNTALKRAIEHWTATAAAAAAHPSTGLVGRR
ncbi:hypothetical protein GPECTOR_108g187 [Gonium pectorale]|uniref:U-box domain-containing protein n=1 Tax=Gonium pectorale TaxID=33097 RepID=A0A150FZG7_GONPE|nr:hypothetical protein GPECTOR_108g187 [Gonium pectorale]|eukprot:KXZ42992.1 hypothetical protein GPECTOR_108g187 [Gonium pectorale]